MTFYGISCFAFAAVLTLLFTFLLLPVLRKKHMGQRILEIGPRWHKSKEGTPTMGGLAFAAAILLVGFVFSLILRREGFPPRKYLLILCYAAANAVVGIVDDAAKLRRKKNEGLLPWQKLLLQTVFAAAFLALLRLYGDDSVLEIPYFGVFVDLGVFYYVILLLFLLGTVNFVNLTDGVDGLAASVTLISGGFYAVMGALTQNLPLLLLSCTLCGGMLGFLFFNAHPAKLFMGDTGSLFLGGLLTGCAFLSGSPLLLVPAGIVYYLEGLSVVLQVLVFKATRKRLFRMAPLHHHFEKGGWSEWKVVYAFCALAVLGAALAVPGIF